jgi:hypothetical protein
MPMEYYLVNKRVLDRNKLSETFLTALPSLCIMGAVMFSNWFISIAFFLSAVIIFWAVYIKDSRFDFKLLKE